MKITNESSPKELVPEGNYVSRCVRIVDLGTQVHPTYGPKRKINLAFELLGEEDEEGNPLFVYRNFSAVLSPRSSLAKVIKSWLGETIEKGESFDLEELLNQPCMVNVVHNEGEDGTVYANVDTITKVPKQMGKVPKAKATDQFCLFLTKNEFDAEIFDSLPDFLKDKIKATDEYKALVGKSKKKSRDEDEDEEEDEKPVKKGKKKVVEDDDDEEDEKPKRRGKRVVEEEEEEDEQPRRTGKKKKVVEEEEEEEEEDEKPRKTAKKKRW